MNVAGADGTSVSESFHIQILALVPERALTRARYDLLLKKFVTYIKAVIQNNKKIWIFIACITNHNHERNCNPPAAASTIIKSFYVQNENSLKNLQEDLKSLFDSLLTTCLGPKSDPLRLTEQEVVQHFSSLCSLLLNVDLAASIPDKDSQSKALITFICSERSLLVLDSGLQSALEKFTLEEKRLFGLIDSRLVVFKSLEENNDNGMVNLTSSWLCSASPLQVHNDAIFLYIIEDIFNPLRLKRQLVRFEVMLHGIVEDTFEFKGYATVSSGSSYFPENTTVCLDVESSANENGICESFTYGSPHILHLIPCTDDPSKSARQKVVINQLNRLLKETGRVLLGKGPSGPFVLYPSSNEIEFLFKFICHKQSSFPRPDVERGCIINESTKEESGAVRERIKEYLASVPHYETYDPFVTSFGDFSEVLSHRGGHTLANTSPPKKPRRQTKPSRRNANSKSDKASNSSLPSQQRKMDCPSRDTLEIKTDFASRQTINPNKKRPLFATPLKGNVPAASSSNNTSQQKSASDTSAPNDHTATSSTTSTPAKKITMSLNKSNFHPISLMSRIKKMPRTD
eukprot:Nk52_evm74s2118 gene=Nk52_evmTU74s2118